MGILKLPFGNFGKYKRSGEKIVADGESLIEEFVKDRMREEANEADILVLSITAASSYTFKILGRTEINDELFDAQFIAKYRSNFKLKITIFKYVSNTIR